MCVISHGNRGCVIEENVVIGSGTSIGRDGGDKTLITGSVIGKNCKIGFAQCCTPISPHCCQGLVSALSSRTSGTMWSSKTIAQSRVYARFISLRRSHNLPAGHHCRERRHLQECLDQRALHCWREGLAHALVVLASLSPQVHLGPDLTLASLTGISLHHPQVRAGNNSQRCSSCIRIINKTRTETASDRHSPKARCARCSQKALIGAVPYDPSIVGSQGKGHRWPLHDDRAEAHGGVDWGLAARHH